MRPTILSARHCPPPHSVLLALTAALLLAGCAAPIRLYPDPTAYNPPPAAPLPPAAPTPPVPPSYPRAQPEAVLPPAATPLPPPGTVGQDTPIPAPTSLPPSPPPPAVSSGPADRLDLLQDWVARQRRLYRVAAPLLMNNTQLCPQFSRRILGFTAKNQYSYSSEFATTAHDGLGLDDALQIANVLPRSGAELAGLQRGDVLVSNAGQLLPKGPDAERAAAIQLSDAAEGNAAVELTVQRGDERISTQVRLTPACAMVIDLGNTDRPATYADGRRVLVTRGMLDLASSDTELAYALAHAIASNIAGPGPKPEVAALIDRLHALNADAAATADPGVTPPVSAEVDAATERLALYLLARANVPLDGVHAFSERMAAAMASDQPAGQATTGLPLADKLALIDRELPVIEMKRKKGAALVP